MDSFFQEDAGGCNTSLTGAIIGGFLGLIFTVLFCSSL